MLLILKIKMPSFPPRYEPIKKEVQLLQRKEELHHAIKHNVSPQKLTKAVEKYRLTQISFFKAQLHVIREKEWQKKIYHLNRQAIENEIVIWINKSIEDILNEFKEN
jgi:hypothetical protein